MPHCVVHVEQANEKDAEINKLREVLKNLSVERDKVQVSHREHSSASAHAVEKTLRYMHDLGSIHLDP